MNENRAPFMAAVLLAPALIGLVVFKLYPIVLAVAESFYETSGGDTLFAGLANYASLAADPIFWNSLWVTLRFNAIMNPLQIALSLLLALLFVRKFAGAPLYRALFLIPIGVSLPTAVIIWRIMLLDDGLVNGLLSLVGIPPQPFLSSEHYALSAIIAIATWKGISYWMIFIVGGLQHIPPELHEAAVLDGASPWQRLTRITLPLLRPTLLFVLVADISINFLLFAPIYMLTSGGPNDATNVLMYEAYKSGFIFGDMGRAMAIVVVVVAIVLVTVAIQFRLLTPRVKEA